MSGSDGSKKKPTHAYVAFTRHGDRSEVVPIQDVVGLSNSGSYDTAVEYYVIWREQSKGNTENDDSDDEEGKQEIDEKDLYPAQILYVGTEVEVNDWIKKVESSGKRKKLPVVKDQLAFPAPKGTLKALLSLQDDNKGKKKKVAQKSAVSSSVNTNISMLLKDVADRQKKEDVSREKKKSVKPTNKEETSPDYKTLYIEYRLESEIKIVELTARNKSLEKEKELMNDLNDALKSVANTHRDNVVALEERIKTLNAEILQLKKRKDTSSSSSGISSMSSKSRGRQESPVPDSDNDDGSNESVEEETDDEMDEKSEEESEDEDENLDTEDPTEMPTDNLVVGKTSFRGKTYVGHGRWILDNAWLDVKKQNKDTKFIKHLTIALLGEESYKYSKTGRQGNNRKGSKNQVEKKAFPEDVVKVVRDLLYSKYKNENKSKEVAKALIKVANIEKHMTDGCRDEEPVRKATRISKQALKRSAKQKEEESGGKNKKTKKDSDESD